MNIPDKILKQYNIEKEVDNVPIRNNSNSGSRGSDLPGVSLSKERRKDINIINKGEIMITKDAALDDLGKINVDAPVGKVIIEVARILIKILATMRTNQLLTDADRIKIKEEKALRDAAKTPKI